MTMTTNDIIGARRRRARLRRRELVCARSVRKLVQRINERFWRRYLAACERAGEDPAKLEACLALGEDWHQHHRATERILTAGARDWCDVGLGIALRCAELARRAGSL